MRRASRLGLALVGVLVVCLASIAFLKTRPVRIGFVAQLTGKQAELGVQERNGAVLAVEQLNARGGIDGRQIELLIRDDLGTPERAELVDEDLIDAGVVALIGHATSAQAAAGLKVANRTQTVMISPTVSTPSLSGIDDHFFRVYPTFKDSARAFADYVRRRDGLKRLAVIHDLDNAVYAETYRSVFSGRFTELGGVIAGVSAFSSRRSPDYSVLIRRLREEGGEGLLIVASDVDTAMIAQKTRLAGWNVPLYTSAWAQTQGLIHHGGKAVEGMKIEQSFNADGKSPAFLEFRAAFSARFGMPPSFGAAFSYEATRVLAEALRKTGGEARGLKAALLASGEFQGLTDSFSFDPSGDVIRPFYLSVVNDGAFVFVEKLN